jgi:hypothetical protein
MPLDAEGMIYSIDRFFSCVKMFVESPSYDAAWRTLSWSVDENFTLMGATDPYSSNDFALKLLLSCYPVVRPVLQIMA